MIEFICTSIADLFDKGGWVMWPLLILSLVALTLGFERCWFWVGQNRPGYRRRLGRLGKNLREGDFDAAKALVHHDRTVYGQVVAAMLAAPQTDAAVTEALEIQRGRLERFMPTLSTIITAAPMLGILGTVTGIIASFDLLSAPGTITDPRDISGGIAEALLTTAAGLMVALLVLFPYNVFRAQIDRAMGRLEALIAAAAAGRCCPGDDPKIVQPTA